MCKSRRKSILLWATQTLSKKEKKKPKKRERNVRWYTHISHPFRISTHENKINIDKIKADGMHKPMLCTQCPIKIRLFRPLIPLRSLQKQAIVMVVVAYAMLWPLNLIWEAKASVHTLLLFASHSKTIASSRYVRTSCTHIDKTIRPKIAQLHRGRSTKTFNERETLFFPFAFCVFVSRPIDTHLYAFTGKKDLSIYQFFLRSFCLFVRSFDCLLLTMNVYQWNEFLLVSWSIESETMAKSIQTFDTFDKCKTK